jgi:hypothetical protein
MSSISELNTTEPVIAHKKVVVVPTSIINSILRPRLSIILQQNTELSIAPQTTLYQNSGTFDNNGDDEVNDDVDDDDGVAATLMLVRRSNMSAPSWRYVPPHQNGGGGGGGNSDDEPQQKRICTTTTTPITTTVPCAVPSSSGQILPTTMSSGGGPLIGMHTSSDIIMNTRRRAKTKDTNHTKIAESAFTALSNSGRSQPRIVSTPVLNRNLRRAQIIPTSSDDGE